MATRHRLFMGGLAADVNAEQLRARCIGFGEVHAVELATTEGGMCRGFGFVDRYASEDDVRRREDWGTGSR